MRRYETIVIVDPDLGEEKYQAVSDRLNELIVQKQGFLILQDDWGVRNMAYEIKGRKRGHYVRLDYCGDGELVAELERFGRIDDRMLKYMTIVLDKDADAEQIKAQMAEAEAAREAAEHPETAEETPETAEETPETTGETPEAAEETSETAEETPEAAEETPETASDEETAPEANTELNSDSGSDSEPGDHETTEETTEESTATKNNEEE